MPSADGKSCDVCKANEITRDGKSCVCADGYYDSSLGVVQCFYKEFAEDATLPSSFRCKRCGSVADRTNCLTCALGNVTLAAGFALSPASGVGGVNVFRAFACASNTSYPGSEILSQREKSASGKLMLKAGASSGCPAGSSGPLCGVCAKEFTGSANEPCVACKEAKNGASSFISFLIFGVLVGGIVFSMMHSASAERAALGGAKKLKEVQGMLRIAVGNYQVISMMPTVFKIDYPSGFENVIKVLRVLSLDILKAFSLDCSFNLSYFDKYLFVMLTPLLLVAIIFAIGEVNGQGLNEMIGSISLLLFLLYPSISAKTFEMFECRNFGDGTRYHQKDYTLDCNSDTYAGYERFASLMVAVYPVGIPGVFLLFLMARKAKLNVEVNEDATQFRHGGGEWKAVEGNDKKLGEALDVQHQMEFLCGSYEQRFFYWELVEYGRKFLLTGALIFAEQSSVSQTFFGMLISFFFFALVSNRQPYKEQAADNLKMLSETQLFVTLLCSLMLQTDLSEQVVSRSVIDKVLVTVNVFAMPIVLGLIVMGALGKKARKSGEATLRADLTKRSGKTEVEMGDINPLADPSAGDSAA